MKKFPQKAIGLLVFAALAVSIVGPAFAQQVPKVAVIDVVRLLEESNEGKQRIEDLKQLQLARNEEGKPKQARVRELRDQITNGRLSLSEERLAQLQKEMEEGLIELRRFEDDATRELQEKQAKMLQEIQAKIMPVIGEVGAEFGYTMIFNKFESGLVYASEAIDITQIVLERLNAPATSAEPGS